MMGIAISAAHLRCGIPVVLYDIDSETLLTAPQRVAEELRLQGEMFDPRLLFCTGSLNSTLLSPVLIETISEKLRAKQRLYQQLQSASDEYTAQTGFEPRPSLFSNTSTISISALAERMNPFWRRRFCGFHFFHPVRQRSLLEIISGKETMSQTIEAARQHALRIEKQPVQVQDGPGFLVNRILNPYLVQALSLLSEGIPMRRIESLATGFGMKMGPFRIMDEIGLDVVLHAGWVLFKAFPDRVPNSPLLVHLVERGRLGRKTGRGFMLYPNTVSWDGASQPDPEIESLLSKQGISPSDLSDDEMIKRLFFSMYEEALRCLEDGVIDDPDDADLASVHALGFPSEKGGIARWGADYRSS